MWTFSCKKHMHHVFLNVMFHMTSIKILMTYKEQFGKIIGSIVSRWRSKNKMLTANNCGRKTKWYSEQKTNVFPYTSGKASLSENNTTVFSRESGKT